MYKPPKNELARRSEIAKYGRLNEPDYPLTSTAQIYAGPGIGLAEIQITVEPPSRSKGKILSTGVPRSEIEQILSSVLIPTLLGRPDYDVRCRLVGAEKYQSSFGLAVAAAVISSYVKKPIPEAFVFMGEIDLHYKIRGGSGRLVENLRRSIACGEVSKPLSLLFPDSLQANVFAGLDVTLIPCANLRDVIASAWQAKSL